jgi:hypothetical protein
MGKYSDELRRRIKRRSSQPDHRLPPCPCLGCGAILDAATLSDSGEDIAPYPGAVSLCWKCGHVQIFAEDMTFRELTDDEIIEIAGAPELVFANTIRGPLLEIAKAKGKMPERELIDRFALIIDAIVKVERQQ